MGFREVQEPPPDADKKENNPSAKLFADSSKEPPSVKEKAENAIKKLGSGKHSDREEAVGAIRKLGFSALPYLHDALVSGDKEVSTRAESFVLELLTQQAGPSFESWEAEGHKLSNCPKFIGNLDDLIKTGGKDRRDKLTWLREAIESSPTLRDTHNDAIKDLWQQIRELRHLPKIKQELEQIKEFKLFSTDDSRLITNDSLTILKNCKNLTHLDLREADKVTDTGLENLKDLSNLEVVKLSRSRVSDQSLRYLDKSAKSIHELALGGISVTEKSLGQLAEQFPKLTVLALFETNITDQGVAELANLSNLERLNLSTTGVGDAGISKLSGLTKLKNLYLSDTNVTQAGVDSLKKALPLCSIVSNVKPASIKKV
jgi:hypothetical protein